jgi:hypothetical protein
MISELGWNNSTVLQRAVHESALGNLGISTSKTCHGDQWMTAEVEVYGNRLVGHISEGEVVLEYFEP